jgi:superoxide dismutase, Fe-Mn family
MNYHVAPLFCRPWTLNGISPRLIESHYENNYGGAVARLNAISLELETLDAKTTSGEAIDRLKRDEMAALNSTLLHELYFASLGSDGRAVPEPMVTGHCSRQGFWLGGALAPGVSSVGRLLSGRLWLGAAELSAPR